MPQTQTLREKLREKRLLIRLCGEKINSPYGSRRKLFAYVDDVEFKNNIRIQDEYAIANIIRQCELISPTIKSLYDITIIDNKERALYEDDTRYHMYINSLKREFVISIPKELRDETYVEVMWRKLSNTCTPIEKKVVAKVECKCNGHECVCTSTSLLAIVALMRFREMMEVANELVTLKKVFNTVHTGTMEVLFTQDADVCTTETQETTIN